MPVDVLISIAIQFPLLVLFVVYNERKDKSFQDFLKEQRREYVGALEKLTTKLDEHDEKTDRAITKMEERTKPRG